MYLFLLVSISVSEQIRRATVCYAKDTDFNLRHVYGSDDAAKAVRKQTSRKIIFRSLADRSLRLAVHVSLVPVSLSLYLSILHRCIYLSLYALSLYLSIYLSTSLSLCCSVRNSHHAGGMLSRSVPVEELWLALVETPSVQAAPQARSWIGFSYADTAARRPDQVLAIALRPGAALQGPSLEPERGSEPLACFQPFLRQVRHLCRTAAGTGPCAAAAPSPHGSSLCAWAARLAAAETKTKRLRLARVSSERQGHTV